jgi:anhydro-N-acetylmuramic acid kinase
MRDDHGEGHQYRQHRSRSRRVIRWQEVREKRERRVAGLISGTSMDGLDMALCRIAPGPPLAVELLHFETAPLPEPLLAELRDESSADLARIARCDMAFGRFMADALADMLERQGARVDLVGSHGQTVYHEHAVTTLQLGEPSFLALRLECPVVHDFRRADMALGGAGAPLVPYLDVQLLARPDRAVLAVNIGGISNLTALPRTPFPAERVIGLDCGPGNMILDRLAWLMSRGELSCDVDGAFAAAGRVQGDLLATLAQHRFFESLPPRTAGREQFGHGYVDDLLAVAQPGSRRDWLDLFATVTELTALAIHDSYRRFVQPGLEAEEVVVSGGGARNPEIMRRLAERFAPCPVRASDALGVPGDAKEAIAFAVLASERIDQRPTSLPSVTGARAAALLGRITEC